MKTARWLSVVIPVIILSVAVSGVVWPLSGPAMDTRPLDQRTEVVFHPNCSKRVLELIRRSTTEVYLSSHQSSGKELARALIDAHHRGVRVTVALDKNKYRENVKRYKGQVVSIHDPLSKAGARSHLFDYPGYPYLHSKVMLVDGKIVVGSMNFDDRDGMRDNYLIFEDDILYQRYKDLFELYLQNRSYPANFVYSAKKEETIEAYFGPAPGFLEPFLKLVDNAQESIRICVVDLNHTPLVEALERAVRRGVKVEIAITARFSTVREKHVRIIESGVRLRQAGARVLWLQGGVHQKIMVVDDRVTLTGSPGFETQPLTINFETYLIVYSKGIAKRYTAEINHVFNMPKARDINAQDLEKTRARFAAGAR